MKSFFYIFGVFVLASLFSCQKAADMVDVMDNSANKEIVLAVGDSFDAVVETKATAISSMPSTLYWGGTTGTSTEAKKWDAASASVSSNKISTGKYQTATPTSYNYYVANQTFSVGATTTMTVANNNTDIIAGRTASATTSLTPSITLNHIFARTGTFTGTLSSSQQQEGYTLSNVTWKIKGKSDINGTAGTYNMTSGAWTAASTKLSSDTAVTSSSDMYLIPGTYTISVAYTVTRGDNVQNYNKSADVELVGGKVNNISGTLPANSVSDIQLSLTLTAWGTNNISNVTFN